MADKKEENKSTTYPSVEEKVKMQMEKERTLISKNDGKSVVEYYGYLSVKFPVALLLKNCPNNIRKLLIENKVLLEEYCERYSCDETILKKYIEDKVLIDDRFLYDEYIHKNWHFGGVFMPKSKYSFE